MIASYTKHVLKFSFDARTSRGALREKPAYFIKIWDEKNPDIFGIGECGPLPKLSPDDKPEFEEFLAEKVASLGNQNIPQRTEDVYDWVSRNIPVEWPSIRFGFETAWFDYFNGGKRQVFKSSFYEGKPIAINGLIWMGALETMLLQITDKVDQGYDCIKIKVGSLDFEKECDILQYIRRKYFQKKLTIRLDANGAFKNHEALEKLHALSKFDIHSIEQPIKAGEDYMAELCAKSPIPVALDEELISITDTESRAALLDKIKPPFIILKPSLLGGFTATEDWIKLSESRNIGWWITSALESNVGLNAIAQFTAQYQTEIPQGLGTGQLYSNNINSPLEVKRGFISYNNAKPFELGALMT
jgi:o-succinylbenzoate synthase